MKNLLLLLLCTTFLNVFGQNFKITPGYPNQAKYTLNSYQHIVAANKPSRSAISPVDPQEVSKRLSSLVSLTGIQVIDSIYIWSWDSLSQEWFADYRIIDIIYSSGFLPEQYITQYRTGSSWTNDYRYTLAYNTNNQMTRQTEEEWLGNKWEFIYQSVFTYDEQQNLTNETYQTWAGDFWEISGRNLYTYDTANHLLSTVYQNLNIDEYENSGQSLYTYDKDGNQIHELSQYWFESQWNDALQIFNTFDHLSNQLFDLIQTFDGIEWTNLSQSAFQYDAQNNRIYHLQQSWNGVEWENENQYHYTYDAANNPATDLTQAWNGTDWETYSTVTYTHDSDNFRVSEVYSYFINGGTQASFVDSTHYYYHSVTGIAEAFSSLNELIVSPNPTTGLFAIDNTEEIVAVDVYSITGALIAHLKPSQDVNHLDVNISGNNPGIYILQVRSASAIHGAKVMLH